jgi:hypothetical protein
VDLLKIENQIRVSKEYIYLKISEEKISITNNYNDGIYSKKLLETRLSEDLLDKIKENNEEFNYCLPNHLVDLGTFLCRPLIQSSQQI